MQVLKDEVRHRILVEAQHLFLDKGYANTTLQMIAAQVGISKSNLYRYFESKQDIFYELTDTAAEGLRRLVLALRGRSGDHDVHEVLLTSDAVYLFLHEQYGLLLIMEHARGTRYEGLRDALTDMFAVRIAPLLQNQNDGELIARVAATNLVSALVLTLKSRIRPAELREQLSRVLRYHTNGLNALTD